MAHKLGGEVLAAAAVDRSLKPYYASKAGALFEGDCADILRAFKSDFVDTIFADPPFNLGKVYGRRTDDSRAERE